MVAKPEYRIPGQLTQEKAESKDAITAADPIPRERIATAENANNGLVRKKRRNSRTGIRTLVSVWQLSGARDTNYDKVDSAVEETVSGAVECTLLQRARVTLIEENSYNAWAVTIDKRSLLPANFRYRIQKLGQGPTAIDRSQALDLSREYFEHF